MRNTVGHAQDSEAQTISDQELIIQAQAGDRDAFEELIRRHKAKTYRTSLFLCNGHTEDAEDTFQNALLKAYLYLRTFRGESLFSTWLTRIVINECLQYQRRSRSRPQGPSLNNEFGPDANISLSLADASDDPEEECSREEFQAIVQRALAAMGERYQSAFVLGAIQGLSNKELAVALGVSIPTAKTRLLRARRRLGLDLARTFCPQGRCYWPGSGSRGSARLQARGRGRQTLFEEAA